MSIIPETASGREKDVQESLHRLLLASAFVH